MLVSKFWNTSIFGTLQAAFNFSFCILQTVWNCIIGLLCVWNQCSVISKHNLVDYTLTAVHFHLLTLLPFNSPPPPPPPSQYFYFRFYLSYCSHRVHKLISLIYIYKCVYIYIYVYIYIMNFGFTEIHCMCKKIQPLARREVMIRGYFFFSCSEHFKFRRIKFHKNCKYQILTLFRCGSPFRKFWKWN